MISEHRQQSSRAPSKRTIAKAAAAAMHGRQAKCGARSKQTLQHERQTGSKPTAASLPQLNAHKSINAANFCRSAHLLLPLLSSTISHKSMGQGRNSTHHFKAHLLLPLLSSTINSASVLSAMPRWFSSSAARQATQISVCIARLGRVCEGVAFRVRHEASLSPGDVVSADGKQQQEAVAAALSSCSSGSSSRGTRQQHTAAGG